MKTLIALLLIPSLAFAESAKLTEAFQMVNQITISSSQAELVSQIKVNLQEAYKLSEKAQSDLLACLEREEKTKEEEKKDK